jgi:hypothetical protein
MVKVFLHYQSEPAGGRIDEQREFDRIPCVGEYVRLSASGDPDARQSTAAGRLCGAAREQAGARSPCLS